MRRKLNPEEKKLDENTLATLSDRDMDIENYLLPKCELELNVGIDLSAKEKKTEYKRVLGSLKEELSMNKKELEIIKDRLKNGVEQKQIKPPIGMG